MVIVCIFSAGANAQEHSSTDVATSSDSSSVYLGLDRFDGDSRVEATASVGGFSSSASEKLDTDGFRLKLGLFKNDFRVQAYLKKESIESFYNDIGGIGVDMAIQFPTSSSLSPYVQAGLALDVLEIEDDYPIDYTSDDITAIGFKLGFGAFFKVNENVELVGGFDWQRRSWSDAYGNIVTAGNQVVTIETSDTSTSLFLGVNLHL